MQRGDLRVARQELFLSVGSTFGCMAEICKVILEIERKAVPRKYTLTSDYKIRYLEYLPTILGIYL
jgi:hypothetical protein